MSTPPGEDESWAVMAQRMHDEVILLRELLRSALVDAAPRLEVLCLESLRQLLRSTQRVQHATQWYAQDVVASLLFLGIDAAVDGVLATVCSGDMWRNGVSPASHHHSLAGPAPNPMAVHYVSALERSACTAMLCQFVLGGSAAQLSGKCLIEALFPLMGSAVRQSDDFQEPLQSSIAPSLFAREKRFQKKRGLASLLLDTVLFDRRDGLKALLAVLLFDDRIGHGATLDAAQQLVALVVRTAPPRVLRLGDDNAFRVVPMKSDDYFLSVCTQLRELLLAFDDAFLSGTVTAGKDGDQPADADLPAFLQKPRHTAPFVKETMEERLHLFLVLCTNKLVDVPGSSSADHAACMRRLHAANRYLLGPTFSALSLRSAPKSEEDVTRSLRCFYSLAKGATLTPVPRCFAMVWDAVAAGIVDMTAATLKAFGAQDMWAKSSHTHVLLLMHVWTAVLHMAPCADAIGMSMAANVFGSMSNRKGAVVWRGVVSGLCIVAASGGVGDALSVVDRMNAAISVFAMCSDAHPSVRYSFFRNACRAAQQCVYLQRSPAAACLAIGSMHCLMAASDLSLWIDIASVHAVVEMVAVCMTLGPLLYRTSIALLSQTLKAADGALWTRDSRSQRSSTRVHLLSINALVHDTQRMMVFTDVFGTDVERDGGANCEALAADEAVLAETIPRLVERLDAVDDDQSSPRNTGNSADPFASALRESCSEIESNLLTRTRAPLAVSVMRLVSLLDSVRQGASQQIDAIAPEVRQRLLHLMVKTLMQSDDVTVLGHAVTTTARCVLLGIIDRCAWTATLCEGVLTSPSAPLCLCGCTVPPVRSTRDTLVARLLDVQLGINDDDAEGVVTKRLDDLAAAQFRFSLVEVLAHIPRDTGRELFLRVATLHLIGQLASALFPRVAVPWITEFATDVFRLSTEDIAKAAAAAMVSSLVMALHGRGDPEVLNTVDLEPLAAIGRHLSSYWGAESRACDADVLKRLAGASSHGDVIRLHGALIVQHLQQMGESLISAAHPSPEAPFDWSIHPLNLWARSGSGTSMPTLQRVLRKV